MMSLSLIGAAFADSTITVTTTNPTDTESNTRTYNYYKIFNASLKDPTDATQGVSYFLNSTAEDTQKGLLDAVKIDDKDVFSFTKTADGTRWIVSITNEIDFTDNDNKIKLSEALKTLVESNTSAFPKSADFAAGEAQTVADGYYLIVSSLGTKMILDTFQTQSIVEKNDYPSNTKTDDKDTLKFFIMFILSLFLPFLCSAGAGAGAGVCCRVRVAAFNRGAAVGRGRGLRGGGYAFAPMRDGCHPSAMAEARTNHIRPPE